MAPQPSSPATRLPGGTRRAVIDVGTNSVKLLVAEVKGREVSAVHEESRQTRLGEGFYKEHRLQPEPIRRTAEAASLFAEKARELGAVSVVAFATSAAREAVNQAELCETLRQTSGLELAIISGETEAEWAFRGVLTHPKFAGRALTIMDLGGGSLQMILGHHGHAEFSDSYPLGCVRLLEQFRPSDPPTPQEKRRCLAGIESFLTERLAAAIDSLLREKTMRESWLVATGGTATILGRMETGMKGFDRDQIEAVCLPLTRMQEWQDRLWGLSLAERRQIPGLPANRADVILMGVAIYTRAMIHFGWEELRISTRGPRFGAVLSQEAS